MRAAIVALTTVIALVTSATAQSRKVLVLPLDGNAPAAHRTSLNDAIVKLAKAKSGGEVTVGDTTFDETAAAVGCNPSETSCAETVRTTLQVDELVYGTATVEEGSTTVMVHRASAGAAPKSQILVIAETDDAAQAASRLEPLYAGTTVSTGGGGTEVGPGPGPQPERAPAGSGFFDTRERKLGVAFGAGGVVSFLIGFSMWSRAGKLQDEIDSHPDRTLADINNLKELEDRAAGKALWGNVFVVLGLAATGVGGYFLWQDRKNRRAAAVTPAPVEAGTGMTFVLRGQW